MTTPPQAQNNSSQTLTRNDPEILELTKDKKPKKAGWLQDEVELLLTLRENNPSMQWAALTELFNKEVTPDRHRSTDSLNSKHKALLKASQGAERLEEHNSSQIEGNELMSSYYEVPAAWDALQTVDETNAWNSTVIEQDMVEENFMADYQYEFSLEVARSLATASASGQFLSFIPNV